MFFCYSVLKISYSVFKISYYVLFCHHQKMQDTANIYRCFFWSFRFFLVILHFE